MCGGHTHLQWTTTIDEGRRFFNPGSVGLAYNRHLPRDRFYLYPVAEFAILTVQDADARLEFCQVPFDLDALERAIRDSGHPFAEQTAARYHPADR
jgi:diadenosine tetraphosphatase ApaH/serine/threonine PP2A family protein phosphatase